MFDFFFTKRTRSCCHRVSNPRQSYSSHVFAGTAVIEASYCVGWSQGHNETRDQESNSAFIPVDDVSVPSPLSRAGRGPSSTAAGELEGGNAAAGEEPVPCPPDPDDASVEGGTHIPGRGDTNVANVSVGQGGVGQLGAMGATTGQGANSLLIPAVERHRPQPLLVDNDVDVDGVGLRHRKGEGSEVDMGGGESKGGPDRGVVTRWGEENPRTQKDTEVCESMRASLWIVPGRDWGMAEYADRQRWYLLGCSDLVNDRHEGGGRMEGGDGAGGGQDEKVAEAVKGHGEGGSSSRDNTHAVVNPDAQECEKMRVSLSILPGRDWGMASNDAKRRWSFLNCDNLIDTERGRGTDRGGEGDGGGGREVSSLREGGTGGGGSVGENDGALNLDAEQCEHMRVSYSIVPGISWGRAKKDDRRRWALLKCNGLVRGAEDGGKGQRERVGDRPTLQNCTAR